MADIELGNLDGREEEEEEQQEAQQETNIDDDDWRNKSIATIDASNPNYIRENLDAMRREDRRLGKHFGAKRRTYTEYKKSILREMGININKGNGPAAKSVFERLKLKEGKEEEVNGAEFDGVRIIVKKGKRLEYTKDVRKASKVNEFKELCEKGQTGTR